MGKVIFIISMSVDGFITGANVRPDNGLGDGGEQLHEWAIHPTDIRNKDLITQAVAQEGAVIAGRTTYDLAISGWEADGPTGPARVPVFVVTHKPPRETPANGVYTFVDNITSAHDQAQVVAGAKNVGVMGGADIARQFLRAGLLDELHLVVVPVLFGKGTRLFEHLGDEHIQLEMLDVMTTTAAIHLRYRVVK